MNFQLFQLMQGQTVQLPLKRNADIASAAHVRKRSVIVCQRLKSSPEFDPKAWQSLKTGTCGQLMPHPQLVAHGEQTRKDVVCLGPGISTAVGYAASNSRMIEGRETASIIDTTELTRAAAYILAALAETEINVTERNSHLWEIGACGAATEGPHDRR